MPQVKNIFVPRPVGYDRPMDASYKCVVCDKVLTADEMKRWAGEVIEYGNEHPELGIEMDRVLKYCDPCKIRQLKQELTGLKAKTPRGCLSAFLWHVGWD